VRRFVRTVLLVSASGAALGGVCGLGLLGVSVLGGRHMWAGMLLLAAVLSWPGGVWTIDPQTSPIQPGTRAADLALVVVGPLVNGAALGAALGAVIACTVWLAGRR
jgi:hypothetical protein